MCFYRYFLHVRVQQQYRRTTEQHQKCMSSGLYLQKPECQPAGPKMTGTRTREELRSRYFVWSPAPQNKHICLYALVRVGGLGYYYTLCCIALQHCTAVLTIDIYSSSDSSWQSGATVYGVEPPPPSNQPDDGVNPSWLNAHLTFRRVKETFCYWLQDRAATRVVTVV